jgi:hypothetical protein
MEENQTSENKIADELLQIGKNLTEVVKAAWESQERRRLQQEIASGLSELSELLRKEAEHAKASPTGQRIRSSAEDLKERIRMGQAESRAREEILSALRATNDQLRKVIDYLSKERETGHGEDLKGRTAESQASQGGEPNRESTPMKDTRHRETHPDDVEADLDQSGER